MNKVKRILTLPDIHEPYNIPLKPVLNFCDDWKPDVVQFLGDTTNAESCNHWKLKHNIRPDVDSVEEDYKNLEKNVLIPFDKAKPRRAKVLYHIGNHEDWFYKEMRSNLKCDKKFGIADNVDVKKYNMKVIPMNKTIHFGHLYYTHGSYLNIYHAAKTALNYRRCLIYCHTHDIQQFFIYSPIDEREKVFAKSVGCLCNMNPDYLKGKPSKWVHAFNIAYIRDDGTFNEYTIIITDGSFISPDGKRY